MLKLVYTVTYTVFVFISLLCLVTCDTDSIDVFRNSKKSWPWDETDETHHYPNDMTSDNIVVRKCCYKGEVLVETVDTVAHCRPSNDTQWTPLFTNEHGARNIQVKHVLRYGKPDCGRLRTWPVYHFSRSADRLLLLPNGKLRHSIVDRNGKEIFYDYKPDRYCIDKVILHHDYLGPDSAGTSQYAVVCVPTIKDTDYHNFVLKILYPLGIVMCLLGLMFTCVVYMVLPQMRDVPGMVIISICMSLVVAYIDELVLIFGETNPHVFLLVTDCLLGACILAAFLWTNVLAYHIWKTMRSRSVFIMVTDARQYSYFSIYVWSSTVGFVVMALVTHFIMDTNTVNKDVKNIARQRLGLLGKAVLNSPVGVVILLNIFWFISTQKVIKRYGAYGRVHQQLKVSFKMLIRISIILIVAWIALLISWSKNEPTKYIWMLCSVLQGILISAVCVCRKRIWFVLRKYFCGETCLCRCCRPTEFIETNNREPRQQPLSTNDRIERIQFQPEEIPLGTPV